MSAVRSTSLILALAICVLLLRPPLISSAYELAMEVCRNTTDFTFCHDAIYSDPRAPGADRVVLAYIAFGKAYTNATDTRDYIASQIGFGASAESGLTNCLKEYNDAVQTLAGMLGDLDSETYYELDKRSTKVGEDPAACEKGLAGGQPLVSHRNHNLMKLMNICYVVSKLFVANLSA